MGITTADPPPGLCLDVTRLISRVGRVMTGVDRVERAYLGAALQMRCPVRFLFRAERRNHLLSAKGAARLAQAIDASDSFDWPRFVDRQSWRVSPLLRGMPKGSLYLNVGHANLSGWRMRMIGRAGLTRLVLLHDTIPLDRPDTQAKGAARGFARKFRAILHHSDGIICNSMATRDDLYRHATPKQPVCVAPLGVTMAEASGDLPAPLDAGRPFFLALGTIEPRKGYGALLDLWAALPEPRPQLAIIGVRGWAGPELLARLDAKPDGVVELGPLPDEQVAAVMDGARALIWLSEAEGYGLPPLEAASRGVPILARPGAAIMENLGNIPVYLGGTDPYSWTKEVMRLARPLRPLRNRPIAPPDWQSHFNLVFSQWW